jgi:hypothetical protein
VKLSEELRRILRRAGCEFVRAGRGDHEIWRSPTTGALLVIDDGMKSRHIAKSSSQGGRPAKGILTVAVLAPHEQRHGYRDERRGAEP